MIAEIAGDDLLGSELSLRGGTCIHKLHFPRPARYSEDLDYVRRTHSGIKPFLRALTGVADRVGLVEAGTEFSGPMVHARFDAEPTAGAGRIRVKVEINVVETDSLLPRIDRPLEVDNPWWTGSAAVPTFAVEELLGTKLRALYQRSKGRDLFDLWLALTTLDVEDESTIDCFRHYIGAQEFTFPQLAQNLAAKLEDQGFRADLATLVTELPMEYRADEAASVLMSRLGRLLKNAPAGEEIEARDWRPSQ